MKKKLEQLKMTVEGSIRRLCNRMTPGKRLVVILLLGAVFTAVNLYMTIWAVYEITRNDYEPISIEDFRELTLPFDDSINLLNEKQDEHTIE